MRALCVLSVVTSIVGFFIVTSLATHAGLNPIGVTGDSRGYIDLANNLLEHGVFATEKSPPYYPESFRAPGYPFFLAVLFTFFGSSLLALFVHALLMSTAPVLLYILFRTYHERAAFWGAVIFACEPVRIFLASSFLSDALFTTLFLASLVSLIRAKPTVLSRIICGALVGVLVLVRPIGIFLPLVYALYLIASERPLQKAFFEGMVVGGVALVVLFPWMYRNHIVFDSWSISSVGSANLVLYNAPEFLKWRPDARAETILSDFMKEQNTLARHEALSLARSAVFTHTFTDIIRGHEVSYLFFHIIKTIPFFLTDGLRDTIRIFSIDIGTMPNISTALMRGDVATVVSYLQTGGLPIFLLVVGSGFWGVVMLLFLFGTLHAIIRKDVFMVFLSVLVFYFAFLTGPVSNARYRVPIEGIMLVLAASVALNAVMHKKTAVVQ